MPKRPRRPEIWPPLTISRRELLADGSDRDFRVLVEDMVQFSARLQAIREGLAACMALTPPHFKIIMTLSHAETPEMTATALSSQLRVSMPFIATETAKLEQLGLISRRRNPDDARSVLISLTAAGRNRVFEAAPRVCEINDRLFASLSRSGMRQLGAMTKALLACADDALGALEDKKATGIQSKPRRRAMEKA